MFIYYPGLSSCVIHVIITLLLIVIHSTSSNYPYSTQSNYPYSTSSNYPYSFFVYADEIFGFVFTFIFNVRNLIFVYFYFLFFIHKLNK
jgi:hypothetical protein